MFLREASSCVKVSTLFPATVFFFAMVRLV
jgi:hypothetical protein